MLSLLLWKSVQTANGQIFGVHCLLHSKPALPVNTVVPSHLAHGNRTNELAHITLFVQE